MVFETIAVVILGALAVFGLYELILYIEYKLSATDKNSRVLTLIPIEGANENAEFLIRSVVAKQKRMQFSRQTVAVVADLGMDAATRAIVERLCEDMDEVYLAGKDDIGRLASLGKTEKTRPKRFDRSARQTTGK